MIHLRTKYRGANRALDGTLCVMLEIDDEQLQDFEKLKDAELVVDLKRFHEKRSVNANAYMWKVITDIASKLGTDNDTIYLMLLKDYGVFEDYEIPTNSIPMVRGACRYMEELYQFSLMRDGEFGQTEIQMSGVRCYKGSSEYDRAQFARLLDGCIQSAHDLGISTWDDEEIELLINTWEAKHERYGHNSDVR